jgi:acetyl-CoA C-acetyltransferase
LILMNEVVIASAARLPVGRLGGALKGSDELTMGALVIKESLARAGISPDQVDEVIMGQNFRSGKVPSNSTRAMAIQAGIPIEVPQITINMHCAAGIKSIILASQAIKSGDAEIIVAGGLELMSQAAYLVPNIRWGPRLGHQRLQDQLIMTDPISGLSMGETAEKLAREFKISREEQDLFALSSQQKANAAIKSGKFKDEIVPIEVPGDKGSSVIFDTDEHPRPETTLEKLGKLKPYFASDGSVTAGNASGMNDGAAAVVVMSLKTAEKLGVEPLAKVAGYASVGVDPSIMGIGPVPSTKKALSKINLSIDDLDLIEINEAFACVGIHFLREFKPDLNRVNVNGGAIALGHPIAATGTVIITKLLYELKRRKGRYGLATMCAGGGQGIALVVDRQI